MTEIFVEDSCFLDFDDEEMPEKTIDQRIEEVNDAMTAAIRQPVRMLFLFNRIFLFRSSLTFFCT